MYHSTMKSVDAGRRVTSLDVLDKLYGGIPEGDLVNAFTLEQIELLQKAVVAASDSLSRMKPAPLPIGEIVYPGGWLGDNWRHGVFRKQLNCALLYEPRLLVHDPLSEYFFSDFSLLPEYKSLAVNGSVGVSGPRLWANHGRRVNQGDDVSAVRQDLKAIFAVLKKYEPLIREGIMVMRSQFPVLHRERHALEASVRADLGSATMLEVARAPVSLPLPRWDNLRGCHVVPAGGLLPKSETTQWSSEFYYLAKTLMFCDSAGALYAPPSLPELKLLEVKCAEYIRGRRSFAPSEAALSAVFKAIIPDMHLDPATAVKIRRSEESFNEWRRELRNVQRESVHVSEGDLPQLVEDLLGPKIEEVRKAVSGSAVLRRCAPKNLTVALISGMGALPGGVMSGALAAISSGVVGYLEEHYFRQGSDGSRPVIAALLHDS